MTEKMTMENDFDDLAEQLISQTHERAKKLRESLRLTELPPVDPRLDEVLAAMARENADLVVGLVSSSIPVPPMEPIAFFSSVSEVDAWEQEEITRIREQFELSD